MATPGRLSKMKAIGQFYGEVASKSAKIFPLSLLPDYLRGVFKMSESQGGLKFSTRIGGILAAAGSAVGMGNIWRFPTQTGENGGSAFLLVYLAVIFIFGIPLLLSEFIIGRRSRANVGNAYSVLAPHSSWGIVGWASAIVAFVIFCYYNVVVAWVLYYLWESLNGSFQDIGREVASGALSGEIYAQKFGDFIGHPWKPLVVLGLTMLVIHVIIVAGVKKGIELASRLLMPTLFFMMILMVFFAFTMPGAGKACEFLFSFNPDYLTPGVFLSAGFMDTAVAVMAGLIIFPAVFSVANASPASGPGLVFVSLPNVFNSSLHDHAFLNWLIPVAFYFILFVAAVTSAMFLHEVATAFLSDKGGMSRRRAATVITLLGTALGVVSSLSMGIWSDIHIFGMNFFEFLDYSTSRIVLPLTGLGASLFVGWRMSRNDVLDELTSGGTVRFIWLPVFLFLLRYVIPILIMTVMITQLFDISLS